jgi:hypothetical protein
MNKQKPFETPSNSLLGDQINRRVLMIMERIPEFNHPHTLTALFNLTMQLFRVHNVAKETVLEMVERFYAIAKESDV